MSVPIYEYRFAACHLKSSFFTRSIYVKVEAVCPHCGSDDMQRVISRASFKMAPGDTRDEDYYSDPSNIGRRAGERFEKFGVDMPDSLRATIDEARKGNMPEGLDI